MELFNTLMNSANLALTEFYSTSHKHLPGCDHGKIGAYFEDLRHKVVEAVEPGMSKVQAAQLFDVSSSSVKRYARITCEGDCLLRWIGASTSEALVDEVGRATYAVATHDALGYFEHCAYQRASQPLVR